MRWPALTCRTRSGPSERGSLSGRRSGRVPAGSPFHLRGRRGFESRVLPSEAFLSSSRDGGRLALRAARRPLALCIGPNALLAVVPTRELDEVRERGRLKRADDPALNTHPKELRRATAAGVWLVRAQHALGVVVHEALHGGDRALE